MKTITNQLNFQLGSCSFIHYFEDAQTCHYPEHVVRLEKQTKKSGKKHNISIKFCTKTVLKSLKI